MKAVMASVPPDILAWRKRTGADRFDEMWEGVLHMVAMPNRDHQDLEWAIETWLRKHWVHGGHGRAHHNVNVAAPGGWPDDYRIPDLILLCPDRYAIDRNEYFDGAPTVVVEIVSPGDESYEKHDFYARLAVPEVWMIDRDTKLPEIWVLGEKAYVRTQPDADGWLASGVTNVQLFGNGDGCLHMRIAGADDTAESLP